MGDQIKKPTAPATSIQSTPCRLILSNLTTMDDTHKEYLPKPKPKPKPETTSFLFCFGFSRKKSLKTVQPADSKKKKRSFSWLRFRMKKSGTKTVPVDSTLPHKIQGNKIHVSKSRSWNWKSDKFVLKSQNSVTNHKTPHQIPAAVVVTSAQASKDRPDQETRYGLEQNIPLRNGKHLDHVDPPKDDTCHKRLSFRRRMDVIRTGFSQPGSPEAKPKSNRSESIRRSASLPTRVHVNQPTTSRVPAHKEKDTITRKFDPMVGMSVIVVTLIIMLLWGRLCAILCTSAWFYFVPRLRTGFNHDDIEKNSLVSGEPDYNSQEYKKKVVLEGFLERNHRNLL